MNCRPEDMRLYAVTDRAWLKGETLESQVEKALKGGATFVQLREKHLDTEAFLEEAKKLKNLCARYHVPFVINDNVEIALLVDADGVHVGQSDMEALDARKKLGPDKIIGVSCKTVEQALLAQSHGADYLGVGAMYPTGTKTDATAVTPEALAAVCKAVDIYMRAVTMDRLVCPLMPHLRTEDGRLTFRAHGSIHSDILWKSFLCRRFLFTSRLHYITE